MIVHILLIHPSAGAFDGVYGRLRPRFGATAPLLAFVPLQGIVCDGPPIGGSLRGRYP